MPEISLDFDHSEGIPFHIKETYGRRPILSAHINELSYKFVVHSNAGFYLQMCHETAAIAKVYHLQHVGDYGIVSAGQPSSLGRDEGVLKRLSIGSQIWDNVPASIFETMGDADQGMLGLKWIEGNQVLMDFSKQLLWVKRPSELSKLQEKLAIIGYTTLEMHRNQETGRYMVDVTINNETRSMIVSTVAGSILDIEFAKAAQVPFEQSADHSYGPTGTVVDRHTSEKPLQLVIGTWTSKQIACEIEDTYQYMANERPATDAVGGMLGAEFLIDHKAVVDFGSRRLYVAGGS